MSYMQLTCAGSAKQLDWKRTTEAAERMTYSELLAAITDCQHTIEAGVDEGYYRDELSVYERELRTREY